MSWSEANRKTVDVVYKCSWLHYSRHRTAMVYPTLLAAVGDVAHPSWRASAVRVYRLWRDGGYAAGALVAGTLADLFGLRWAIGAVGVLTLISGFVVATVMYETRRVTAAGAEARSSGSWLEEDQ